MIDIQSVTNKKFKHLCTIFIEAIHPHQLISAITFLLLLFFCVWTVGGTFSKAVIISWQNRELQKVFISTNTIPLMVLSCAMKPQNAGSVFSFIQVITHRNKWSVFLNHILLGFEPRTTGLQQGGSANHRIRKCGSTHKEMNDFNEETSNSAQSLFQFHHIKKTPE